jgi:hypothetical protein
MKTSNKLAIAATLLAIATIAAGQLKTRNHEVVILKANDYYYTLGTGAGNCGNGSGYNGAFVYNASSSANAPQYKLPVYWTDCAPPTYTNTPINFAEAIAQLLEDGFTIQHTSLDGYTITLVK